MDFVIKQGATRRITMTTTEPGETNPPPYDFTNATVRVKVECSPPILKIMTVNGSGVGSSTDGVSLGRPNPADWDGPLIDTAANSGYVTVRFAPEDTAGIAMGTYRWEARAEGGGDKYPLDEGMVTIADSIFEVEP